jgi:hypothetical protein
LSVSHARWWLDRLRDKIRLAVIIGFSVLLAWAIGERAIWFWLNSAEFGGIFLKPVDFEIYSGVILASLALFRIDFRKRRSMVWWSIRLLLGATHNVQYTEKEFSSYKMPASIFIIWQLTKVLFGMMLLSNIFFGLALVGAANDINLHIDKIPVLFTLPFITPPSDMSFAQENVIPAIPLLSWVIAPLLGAVGIRILLLYGLTQLLLILVPKSSEDVKGDIESRTSRGLKVIGVLLLWLGATMPFTANIDYNTRYIMSALLISGVLLITYSHRKLLIQPNVYRMTMYLLRRFMPLVAIAIVTGSVVTVNNSIADARKVEWLGPYVAQQIAVNRHIADLDDIREVNYNFGLLSVRHTDVNSIIKNNTSVLNEVRLWDSRAAFDKLRPEIGLIPFVDFQDTDVIRFNDTLYWSASMRPKLPPSVRAGDVWYAEHLVYTHVPNGFLLLNAFDGKTQEPSSIFKQRQIYYGEGGLFKDAWVAYPKNRVTSDELGGAFYQGSGGVDISPPLSWFVDSNFFWAFRDQSVHIMRYRDVHDRMNAFMPFFTYGFDTSEINIIPVTDGQKTYWLMPLIARLDTFNVPFSADNSMYRLVGYALIDVYDGKTQLVATGDDIVTQIFLAAYKDHFQTQIPQWLNRQLRYPEEMFIWRVYMYNNYHVTDPAVFIVGKEFYEIPAGLGSYYVMAKPLGFEKSEFLGLLSLEIRGGGGKNLAGYMVVRNDLPNNGEMIFYKVPLESETKLLGPSAVREALEKDSEFAQLRTLLRQPRVGDNVIYRVGDIDVYIIPVYTAGGGGVVAELGVVAVVGAGFTGEYKVGLGQDISEAFRDFLLQIGGTSGQEEDVSGLELDELIDRADASLNAYLDAWSKGNFEEAGKHLQEFTRLWKLILEKTGK